MTSLSLKLYHQLLLLALHDQTGARNYVSMLELGLAGAILSELAYADRLRVVEEGINARWLEIVDASPVGDAVMDSALNTLVTSKGRMRLETALSRISRLPRLWHHIAADLARWGIVQETEKQVLFLFRQARYPTVNPEPERELITSIRAVMSGVESNERVASLIALAAAVSALGTVYSKKELTALAPRIKALGDREGVGKTVALMIRAIVVAVIVTTTTSAAVRV